MKRLLVAWSKSSSTTAGPPMTADARIARAVWSASRCSAGRSVALCLENGPRCGTTITRAVLPPDFAFVARCVLQGASGQGSLTLGLAMLLDVLAHDVRASGRSREGVMVGVFALAEKGAFAFGPLLTGVLLGAMGFMPSTGGAITQPPETIFAARLAMSLIPAALGSVAIVALLLYRLPEESSRRPDGGASSLRA